jgi:hypothetical protein
VRTAGLLEAEEREEAFPADLARSGHVRKRGKRGALRAERCGTSQFSEQIQMVFPTVSCVPWVEELTRCWESKANGNRREPCFECLVASLSALRLS